MKKRDFNRTWRYGLGFTLVELLVVVAVVSGLLAILLPTLHRARATARRIRCAVRLHQIGLAWEGYFADHNDRLYRAPQGQYTYGGWSGTAGQGVPWPTIWSVPRPLNAYVGLKDPNAVTERTAKPFLCPSDSGGAEGWGVIKLYQVYGNSYVANVFLIGPGQVPEHFSPASPARTQLHQAINRQLPNMTRSQVTNPWQEVILAGDYGWYDQVFDVGSEDSAEQARWHGRTNRYNVLFLGGHVEFLKMTRDRYFVPGRYSMLPFQALNKLAGRVHREAEEAQGQE